MNRLFSTASLLLLPLTLAGGLVVGCTQAEDSAPQANKATHKRSKILLFMCASISKAVYDLSPGRGRSVGIHWPDLDEDLSTEGLLRGAPAPHHSANV